MDEKGKKLEGKKNTTHLKGKKKKSLKRHKNLQCSKSKFIFYKYINFMS
jgi:hypothetical protein